MTEMDICMVAPVNKTMKNKILLLHSEWLFNNGYYADSIDCLNEAEKYSQKTDWRQTKLKRTCVHAMPRASLCTSSDNPHQGGGSPGAFAPTGLRARKL
jgi:hypothetical protein